jgi:hypothetical protein
MAALYFLACVCCFSVIAWIMVRSIGKPDFPSDGDDDGGLPGNGGLPIIDLPPGGKSEDLLMDRWYTSPSKQRSRIPV